MENYRGFAIKVGDRKTAKQWIALLYGIKYLVSLRYVNKEIQGVFDHDISEVFFANTMEPLIHCIIGPDIPIKPIKSSKSNSPELWDSALATHIQNLYAKADEINSRKKWSERCSQILYTTRVMARDWGALGQ